MSANDHCTGKLNYVKLIRESIWFAMIDSRIDSVHNILIRCTPSHGFSVTLSSLWTSHNLKLGNVFMRCDEVNNLNIWPNMTPK